MDMNFSNELEWILEKHDYEHLLIHEDSKTILDKFKNKKFILGENGDVTFCNGDVVFLLCYKLHLYNTLDSCGYCIDDLDIRNIGEEYQIEQGNEYIIITLHKTKNSYLKYKMMY